MTDADRIDALEMRIAHHEATIEDLNAALTEQWKLIDRLTREMASLADRTATIEMASARPPGDEPPPPHW
jgi:SlyX protein